MENSRKMVLIEAFDAVFDAVSELAEMERKKVLGLVDELLDVEQEQISREVNELLDDEELAPMEDLSTNRICQPYPKEEFTRYAVRQLTGFRQAQVFNVLVTMAHQEGDKLFYSPTDIGNFVYDKFGVSVFSSASALVCGPLNKLIELGLVESSGNPGTIYRCYRLTDKVDIRVTAMAGNTPCIINANGHKLI